MIQMEEFRPTRVSAASSSTYMHPLDPAFGLPPTMTIKSRKERIKSQSGCKYEWVLLQKWPLQRESEMGLI